MNYINIKKDIEFLNKNIALVFAHPDDEVLIASSIIKRSNKLIFCYSYDPENIEVSKNREIIKQSYPLEHAKFLSIPEIARKNPLKEFLDWRYPEETEYGMKILSPSSEKDKYRESYESLSEYLRSELVGIDAVITHNPWGEYGHPLHVQVHRAVCNIAKNNNFTVYVPAIFALKSKVFMSITAHKLDSQPIYQTVDKDFWYKMQNFYLQNNAWTWNRYDEPRSYDIFYKVVDYSVNSKKDSSYTSQQPLYFIDKPFRIHTFAEFLSMTNLSFIVNFFLKAKHFITKHIFRFGKD